MKDKNIFIGVIALVVLFFGFGIYTFVRNYKECRLVPHTTFYCLTKK